VLIAVYIPALIPVAMKIANKIISKKYLPSKLKMKSS
jgi:hypothetical protein